MFRKACQNLADAGYTDELTWKDLKETIIENKQSFDALNIIELRNIYVEKFPHEMAFITYLEQQMVAIVYNFGKSQKVKLYAAAKPGKLAFNL